MIDIFIGFKKRFSLRLCAFAFIFFCFVVNPKGHCSTEKKCEQTEPFVFVVFGGTGDLMARKLMPAMAQLSSSGCFPANTTIVGIGRRPYSDADFRAQMEKALSETHGETFHGSIYYHCADFGDDVGYDKLQILLDKIDREQWTLGKRIFFLAVQPAHCSAIIEKLHAHGLLEEKNEAWSRLIIEKPCGMDLQTSQQLQAQLARCLKETQTYRMDHYLGKEGVQNILAFRFDSALLEPIWNHQYIDHIQITLAEDIGIGSRANFWEETGALRDLLQSHIMQLIALVAMDKPASLAAREGREARIKLLAAIRPLPLEAIDEYVVRGQYAPGIVKGEATIGYREEPGVPENSTVETYVAAKFFIDNPRWKGVPFYVRAGKRLTKQVTEIVVVFKGNPGLSESAPNILLFRIQPRAGIYLKMFAKHPGLAKQIDPVLFGFQPEAIFKTKSPEAYEKLIFDCARGDRSLYVDGEEQLHAWRLLTPVLEYWKKYQPTNFPNYRAGSWGPEAAEKLLQRQGHKWLEVNSE